MEEQIKIKKGLFALLTLLLKLSFIFLVQKALLTCRINQKIKPIALQNFVGDALKLDLSE